MYKTLKINDKEDNIWFTGCRHSFHLQPFIWQKRGYQSVTEHMEAQIASINKVVKQTDTLIDLGDGFLNSTTQDVTNWFNRINCQNIIYIFGNHESAVGRLYKDKVKELYFCEDIEVYPLNINYNVKVYGNYQESYINGQGIVLSHFPFAIWNESHKSSWNIHSHNHGNFKESLPNYLKVKRLDVGWDVFSRPISFKEVKDIMAKKEVQTSDHHNSATT